MVVTAKLLQTSSILGWILFAIGISASPTVSPAELEKRISDAALQARWDVIFKQVGKDGMQSLCQAVLPHATATRTSIITSPVPSTLTETSSTTKIETTTLTEVSSIYETVTETAVETAFVTQTALARRGDLSNALQKLFRFLFGDAKSWTITKCRALQYSPLTDTVTTTTTTYTPSVATTATDVITISDTTILTTTLFQTHTNTARTTTTTTATVLVSPPDPQSCQAKVPSSVPIARLPNTLIIGNEVHMGVYPSSSEAECVSICTYLQG